MAAQGGSSFEASLRAAFPQSQSLCQFSKHVDVVPHLTLTKATSTETLRNLPQVREPANGEPRFTPWPLGFGLKGLMTVLYCGLQNAYHPAPKSVAVS